MNLTRTLRFAFGLLLGVHMLMAFGAVALLARMRPAIEDIIVDNVYSLEAVEEMLAVVASSEGARIEGDARQRFEAAFSRVEANITDPRERPLVDAIRDDLDGALGTDLRARADLLERLRALGRVNRDDLERSDRDAQQLSSAGAWSVVLLAVITFTGGIVVLRRLDRRVLHAIEELYDVVDRARAGDPHRRCRTAIGAASELGEVMQAINDLLDDRVRTARLPPRPAGNSDRAVLLHLLDERSHATVVLNEDGEVVAANEAGLDSLSSDEGLRETLQRVSQQPGDNAADHDLEVSKLDEGRRILVTLGDRSAS